MTAEADAIASAVLKEFHQLPGKRKPTVRGNGLHEWVPLSGIVAEKNGAFTCISLGTGMKCLPASKLPRAKGVTLHDWHAEILAIRSFNYFLAKECQALLSGDETSGFIRMRNQAERETRQASASADQPFAWREDVSLHMYCSEAPCGDASMELIMEAQEDATPWATPSSMPEAGPPPGTEPLHGRAFFSQLGVVRRKPARSDAPPTLSKSCSDKIALKQCTSLLSSLTSLLVSPKGVYLKSLVLPEPRFSAQACCRAFSPEGRMKMLVGKEWDGGYSSVPLRIETCSQEFDFSQREVSLRSDKLVASNLAVAWSRNGLAESLLGGSLQGCKQFHENGASRVSRRQMWALVVEIARRLGIETGTGFTDLFDAKCYQEVKESKPLETRRKVKKDVREFALQDWVQNAGDENFSLESS